MGRLAMGPVVLVLAWLGCGTEPPLAKDIVNGFGMEQPNGKDDLSPSASRSSNQPIALAVEQFNPFAIALDDDFVYWTNSVNSPGGQVLRCAKIGCPQGPTVIASGLGYPWSIAVDSSFVYWTNKQDGTIAKCPVGSTCGQTPILVATDQGRPAGIAVNRQAIFWAAGGIYRCGLDQICGSAPTRVADDSVAGAGFDVALDDHLVYWGSANGAAIMACPLDSTCGAAPLTVAGSLLGGPLSIAIGGDFLYWADDRGNPLMCRTDAPCAPSLQATFMNPRGISVATDMSNMYWIGLDEQTAQGTIFACALGTPCTSPTEVVTGQVFPYGLAVDRDAIYFTTTRSVRGTVMKLLK